MSVLPKLAISHTQLEATTVAVCSRSSSLFPPLSLLGGCSQRWALTKLRTPFWDLTLPIRAARKGLTMSFVEHLSLLYFLKYMKTCVTTTPVSLSDGEAHHQ